MATVAEATKQLNLSKEIQLDAQEMVRRAERGVGQAVRKGQRDGEIATRGNRELYAGPHHRQSRDKTLSSPADYLPHGNDRAAAYAMADDVSDEQFDAALETAKEEQNLSRANVVRKVREQTVINPSKIPTSGVAHHLNQGV